MMPKSRNKTEIIIATFTVLLYIVFNLNSYAFAQTTQQANVFAIVVADTYNFSAGTAIEAGEKRVTQALLSIQNGLSRYGSNVTIVTASGNNFSIASLNIALDYVAKRAKRNDTIIFYYTGHGRNGGKPYPFLLIPDKSTGREGVQFDYVWNWLQAPQARLNIYIIEACNNFVINSGKGSSDDELAQLSAPDISTEMYELFIKYKGVIIFASASPGEFAHAYNSSGGVFTGRLLASLLKEMRSAHDKNKYAADWDAIFDDVRPPFKIAGKKQTPMVASRIQWAD